MSHIGRLRCPLGMTTTRTQQATTDADRRARIRVPVAEPSGLLGRLVMWYSRRTYGDVLDNALVLWQHHKRAMLGMMTYETQVQRYRALDPQLKAMAELAVAAQIGCSWCVDFGYFHSHARGLDVVKLRAVTDWRGSDLFDDTERAVLELAEAGTATPPTVTDEMVEGLTERIGASAVVELVAMVALENQRSRFNSALGLTSQGFSDVCELPPPQVSRAG